MSPISEKQLEANRRNAQLSTGPRTESGKSKSALNARRHGLTGQVTVMTPAQREAHDLFITGFIEDLEPETPMERNLAESAAEDSWRINRLRALEENIYALGCPAPDADTDDHDRDTALAHARTFVADPKQFQLLSLYEQRLHRTMLKSIELLGALQNERKAARAQALEEALLLAQLAESEGRAYDSAKDANPENGFVFSTAEINSTIHHRRRVLQARMLAQPQQRAARMSNAA